MTALAPPWFFERAPSSSTRVGVPLRHINPAKEPPLRTHLLPISAWASSHAHAHFPFNLREPSTLHRSPAAPSLRIPFRIFISHPPSVSYSRFLFSPPTAPLTRLPARCCPLSTPPPHAPLSVPPFPVTCSLILPGVFLRDSRPSRCDVMMMILILEINIRDYSLVVAPCC